MQAKLESALDTIFYFKHRALLRDGFERIHDISLPTQSSSAVNFSLVNVVQYYPHGNKILRDADVLATLTKLFTVSDEQIGLQNEAIQEVLVNVVAQFARLEGELVQLRRKSKPKPALHMMSDSEYNILMDHKSQLEQNIDSLEKQVTFLRDTKKKNDDKYREQIDKQVQQIAHLNGLLEQATREKDSCLIDLQEKEKTLQATIVHLNTAQEEIRHLTNDRSQSKLKEKQDADEINDIIQRHSKYSAAQFTQLSAQLDAMRLELKKEKNERLHERDDMSRENSQLKKKLIASESMVEALNKRFMDVSSVGLHNYNVQNGNAIDINLPESSTSRKERDISPASSSASRRINRQSNNTPLQRSSSRSRTRGRIPSNASAHYEADQESGFVTRADDPRAIEEGEEDRGAEEQEEEEGTRSSVRPKNRYYQQIPEKFAALLRQEQQRNTYQHEGPIKSLRDPDHRQQLIAAEENRRRSRSESPSFRGKHILYQPAVIQTPSHHPLASSLNHPLRNTSSSLLLNPEELAQRLVYSQNSSVLSPNAKRRLQQQQQAQPSSEPYSEEHVLGSSDQDSDAISSIPKNEGEEDDEDHHDRDHHYHAHNNTNSNDSKYRTNNNVNRPLTDYMYDSEHIEAPKPSVSSPARLHSASDTATAPDHHTHSNNNNNNNNIAYSSGSFAVSSTIPSQHNSPHRSVRSSAEEFHPHLNTNNNNNTNMAGILSPLSAHSLAATGHRAPSHHHHHHHNYHNGGNNSSSDQTSSGNGSPGKEMAVQTERSDHLMDMMRGNKASSGSSNNSNNIQLPSPVIVAQASDIALKFTNKLPASHTAAAATTTTAATNTNSSATAIHRTFSDAAATSNNAHHPLLTPYYAQQPHAATSHHNYGSSDNTFAAAETPQQALYDLLPHQQQLDGDETVVSMGTLLPPNHRPRHHNNTNNNNKHNNNSPSKKNSNNNAQNDAKEQEENNNNNNNSTWNILFQKKEYLDFDPSALPIAAASNSNNNGHSNNSWSIAGPLFQQVVAVYNTAAEDYNALLRMHREEYAEHERIKSDFKTEIYESVSKIHDLQTKLHVLSLENDHLQNVLNHRGGLDNMTIVSANNTITTTNQQQQQPHNSSSHNDDSLLLQQQQSLLQQQTQEVLQQMQERWLESEAKLADLLASANNASNNHANAAEYAMGLDRSICELPKLITLFEDNCQLLTNLSSEKIMVSKLFVWDLLHVLNNIQHHWLRQMHQTHSASDSLQQQHAQTTQNLAQTTQKLHDKEQLYQELLRTHDKTLHELQHTKSLHQDWQSQQSHLQSQLQHVAQQLLQQEKDHEALLQQRIQQEYESWHQKHMLHTQTTQKQQQQQQQEAQEAAEAEEERQHVQQLQQLHEQLAQTRQALQEMKQTQEELALQNQHEDHSLLKILMHESTSNEVKERYSYHGNRHNSTSSNSNNYTKDAHYQEDLQYISDLKTRLEALHGMLAKDPKYRHYVTNNSDSEDHHSENNDENDDDENSDNSGEDNQVDTSEQQQQQMMMVTFAKEQIEGLFGQKRELEERLLRSEARVTLLTQQLESMPPSLTVAQAEKRVMEAKLAKAIEAHDFNLHKLQHNAVQKITEISSFLNLEKQEKLSLQQQLQDQQKTIHRLTHHLKLLQAQGQQRTREYEIQQTLLHAYPTTNNNNNNGSSSSIPSSHGNHSFMSTATALDILHSHHNHHHLYPSSSSTTTTNNNNSKQQEMQLQQSQELLLKDAALSSLGLSLGVSVPWEAGALPRTHHASTNNNTTHNNTTTTTTTNSSAINGNGVEGGGGAGSSAPSSRRTTPQRVRPSPSSHPNNNHHQHQKNNDHTSNHAKHQSTKSPAKQPHVKMSSSSPKHRTTNNGSNSNSNSNTPASNVNPHNTPQTTHSAGRKMKPSPLDLHHNGHNNGSNHHGSGSISSNNVNYRSVTGSSGFTQPLYH